MSFLEKAKRAGEELNAPIFTIIGSPGSGKTTLGGLFPSAIIMQAERAGTVFESWKRFQPMLLPLLHSPQVDKDAIRANSGVAEIKHSTFNEAMAQIRELLTENHDFQTLVVDSVSAMDMLFQQEILLKYGVDAIGNAAGGYNKGYDELASMHARFMHALKMLATRRRMAVVILAHTGIEKRKLSPDESAEYAVYSLGLHEKSSSIYIRDSDNVFYIKKEKFIIGEEKNKKGEVTKLGRAQESGERTLVADSTGVMGYVHAKNRYRMPEEMPLVHGQNPILAYVPFFGKSEEVKKEKPKKKVVVEKVEKKEDSFFENQDF
jgi:hypothetical protein